MKDYEQSFFDGTRGCLERLLFECFFNFKLNTEYQYRLPDPAIYPNDHIEVAVFRGVEAIWLKQNIDEQIPIDPSIRKIVFSKEKVKLLGYGDYVAWFKVK